MDIQLLTFDELIGLYPCLFNGSCSIRHHTNRDVNIYLLVFAIIGSGVASSVHVMR